MGALRGQPAFCYFPEKMETERETSYRHLKKRIGGFLQGQREESLEELLRAAFVFQFTWNRPYQNFCRARGVPDPAAIHQLAEIPAVPTEAFKLPDFPLRCFPEKACPIVFRTSGTTQEERGQHWFPDTELYALSIRQGWETLVGLDLPVACLCPAPSQAADSSLSHMMGQLAAADAFFLDPERGFDRAGLVEASQGPLLLMSTAIGFLRFCQEEGRLPLPPGSVLLETGGYKGLRETLSKEALYQRLSDHFEVSSDDILNEYSMTELSSQFYSRGLGRVHFGPAWVRAEVIDPATGQAVAAGEGGLLRIFDLANLASVSAIQTQDLAIRGEREDEFFLIGRDPQALPRGCSRGADALWARP